MSFSDEDFIKRWQEKYGELDYRRIGFTYHAFDHEKFDSELTLSVDEENHTQKVETKTRGG